jgi:4'-phosphopantetheinyl transferase
VTAPRRTPPSGTADVWVVDVTSPRFLSTAESSLPSERDRLRASALASTEAGQRLLARRAGLRLILAQYVTAEAAELRIVTAPGGKPVLLPGPAFSLAYSGSVLAVAVSGSPSVGVDVERRRDVPRASAIARRWFSEGESRALSEVVEPEQNEAFLRLWTAKEALAKRHGAGLRLMKGAGADAGGALDVAAAVSDRSLAYFDAGADYVAAVALSAPIENVVVLTPPEELWIT